MKTTLVLFVAALFLMTIPLSVSASGGGRHDGGSKHYKGQVEDRYDGGAKHYQGQGKGRRDSDHFRQARDHRWDRRAKKHFKRHQYKSRRNHRYVVRRYNPRPYFDRPAVVIGVPRIVFNLDW